MDGHPPHQADQQLETAEAMLAELERVEQQLQSLQDGLMRSHRLVTLGTLATVIAHELNNLLTPVISYAQLSEQNPDDIPLMQKAIARSRAGAEKAAEIVNSVLGFARNEAGSEGEDEDEEGVNRPTASLQEVIDDVFNTLAREPAKDGIHLSVEIPDGACVYITPTALQQVLLNLVLNATQAMAGSRSGKLTIRATPDPVGDEAGTTLVEVIDTGPGVPEDLRETIFKPFVTRRDPAAGSSGTGLGLAICRDLIRYAGGTIELADTSDRGTTFAITLITADARIAPTAAVADD